MTLSAGARLGPYEVIAPLGAGGMGEVYRARDTKLDRDVAIKVLPDLFAADRERLIRFEREAKTLAALNHPNIAQIYGLESSVGNTRALVMELVEGEDLSAIISRGPMTVADAVPIARQIADALEAAHEVGIIHRDLKPANIKIRRDGTVKVLDFGLAKAMDFTTPDRVGPAMNSPTITSPAMTQMGVILGTAAYMSPEQARGKPVDRRADIWAFGVVLYEMLSGRRPFDGETMTDALSAIVTRDPDWKALPADATRTVTPLLRRCLDKDPRKRLQSIGEARIALETPASSIDADARGRRLSKGVAALLVLGALAAGALGAWTLTRRTPPPPPAREAHLSLPIAPAESLTGNFVLSPDGRQLAFVGLFEGKNHLFLRRLDQDQASVIRGTEGVFLAGPTFSPDGRWLAFMVIGTLKKVPVDGGPIVTLAQDTGGGGSRPSWGDDDKIVYSNGMRGLSRIPASGGQPQVLTAPDPQKGEIVHEMPWVLPGARTLLFSARQTGGAADSMRVIALTLGTTERRELFPGMVLGLVGDDRLIIGRSDAIVSIPFDAGRAAATGEPVPLLSDILNADRGLYTAARIPQFTIARNGTIVFLPGSAQQSLLPLTMFDRSGKSARVAAPGRVFSDPRVSPDGHRIALHVFEPGRDNWVLDLRNGAFTRLSFDAGEDETPVWSPDGRWIYWTATREKVSRAIYRKAADGSGNEQLVWSGDAHIHLGGVTPDNSAIVMSVIDGPYVRLASLRIADGKLTTLLSTPFSNSGPSLSPDGRCLAYTSNESGQSEIYVQPFPSMQGRTQVSAGGGAEPVWARNGRELYFRGKGKFMAAPASTTNSCSTEVPQPLFDDRQANAQGTGHTGYDTTLDGKLVMIASVSSGEGHVTHLRILYRP